MLILGCFRYNNNNASCVDFRVTFSTAVTLPQVNPFVFAIRFGVPTVSSGALKRFHARSEKLRAPFEGETSRDGNDLGSYQPKQLANHREKPCKYLEN